MINVKSTVLIMYLPVFFTAVFFGRTLQTNFPSGTIKLYVICKKVWVFLYIRMPVCVEVYMQSMRECLNASLPVCKSLNAYLIYLQCIKNTNFIMVKKDLFMYHNEKIEENVTR